MNIINLLKSTKNQKYCKCYVNNCVLIFVLNNYNLFYWSYYNSITVSFFFVKVHLTICYKNLIYSFKTLYHNKE